MLRFVVEEQIKMQSGPMETEMNSWRAKESDGRAAQAQDALPRTLG